VAAGTLRHLERRTCAHDGNAATQGGDKKCDVRGTQPSSYRRYRQHRQPRGSMPKPLRP
jgi:hypothetical protein